MEEEVLFDTALLEELGDKKSTMIVLGFFIDNSPKDLKELEKFIAESNLPGIFNKAHKLKGSLAMLKSNTIVAILEQIEIAAGVEKDLERSKSLCDLFVVKYGLLQIQLQNEVLKIKSSLE